MPVENTHAPAGVAVLSVSKSTAGWNEGSACSGRTATAAICRAQIDSLGAAEVGGNAAEVVVALCHTAWVAGCREALRRARKQRPAADSLDPKSLITKDMLHLVCDLLSVTGEERSGRRWSWSKKLKVKRMKFRNLICTAAVLAGSIGTAHAIPVTWEAEHNPTDFRLSAPNQTAFPLDIRPDGYRPGIDTINSAELTVRLYDDTLLGDAGESVRFSFNGGGWTNEYDVDGGPTFLGTIIDSFSFDDLESFLGTGVLNVVVRATEGDFMFASASLRVRGDSATSVPEPTTLSLLGLGIVALGFAVRRRRV